MGVRVSVSPASSPISLTHFMGRDTIKVEFPVN